MRLLDSGNTPLDNVDLQGSIELGETKKTAKQPSPNSDPNKKELTNQAALTPSSAKPANQTMRNRLLNLVAKKPIERTPLTLPLLGGATKSGASGVHHPNTSGSVPTKDKPDSARKSGQAVKAFKKLPELSAQVTGYVQKKKDGEIPSTEDASEAQSKTEAGEEHIALATIGVPEQKHNNVGIGAAGFLKQQIERRFGTGKETEGTGKLLSDINGLHIAPHSKALPDADSAILVDALAKVSGNDAGRAAALLHTLRTLDIPHLVQGCMQEPGQRLSREQDDALKVAASLAQTRLGRHVLPQICSSCKQSKLEGPLFILLGKLDKYGEKAQKEMQSNASAEPSALVDTHYPDTENPAHSIGLFDILQHASVSPGSLDGDAIMAAVGQINNVLTPEAPTKLTKRQKIAKGAAKNGLEESTYNTIRNKTGKLNTWVSRSVSGRGWRGTVAPVTAKTPFTPSYKSWNRTTPIIKDIPVVGNTYPTIGRPTAVSGGRPGERPIEMHLQEKTFVPGFKMGRMGLDNPTALDQRRQALAARSLSTWLIDDLENQPLVRKHFTEAGIDPTVLQAMLKAYQGKMPAGSNECSFSSSALKKQMKSTGESPGKEAQAALDKLTHYFPKMDVQTLDMLHHEANLALGRGHQSETHPLPKDHDNILIQAGLQSEDEKIAETDSAYAAGKELHERAGGRLTGLDDNYLAHAWLGELLQAGTSKLVPREVLVDRAVNRILGDMERRPAMLPRISEKHARDFINDLSRQVPELNRETIGTLKSRLNTPNERFGEFADEMLEMAKPLSHGSSASASQAGADKFLNESSNITDILATHAWIKTLSSQPTSGNANHAEMLEQARGLLRSYGMQTPEQEGKATQLLRDLANRIPNLQSEAMKPLEKDMHARSEFRKQLFALVDAVPNESRIAVTGGGEAGASTKAITEGVTHTATFGVISARVAIGATLSRNAVFEMGLGSDGFEITMATDKGLKTEFGAGTTFGVGGTVGLSKDSGATGHLGVSAGIDGGPEYSQRNGVVYRTPRLKYAHDVPGHKKGEDDLETTKINAKNLLKTLLDNSPGDALDAVLTEHPDVSVSTLEVNGKAVNVNAYVSGNAIAKFDDTNKVNISARLKGSKAFNVASQSNETGGSNRIDRADRQYGVNKVDLSAAIQLGDSIELDGDNPAPAIGINHLVLAGASAQLVRTGEREKIKVVDLKGAVNASNTYLEQEFLSREKFLRYLRGNYDVWTGEASGGNNKTRAPNKQALESNRKKVNDVINLTEQRKSTGQVYQVRFVLEDSAAKKIDAYHSLKQAASHFDENEAQEYHRKEGEVLGDEDSWKPVRLAVFDVAAAERRHRALDLGLINVASRNGVKSNHPDILEKVSLDGKSAVTKEQATGQPAFVANLPPATPSLNDFRRPQKNILQRFSSTVADMRTPVRKSLRSMSNIDLDRMLKDPATSDADLHEAQKEREKRLVYTRKTLGDAVQNTTGDGNGKSAVPMKAGMIGLSEDEKGYLTQLISEQKLREDMRNPALSVNLRNAIEKRFVADQKISIPEFRMLESMSASHLSLISNPGAVKFSSNLRQAAKVELAYRMKGMQSEVEPIESKSEDSGVDASHVDVAAPSEKQELAEPKHDGQADAELQGLMKNALAYVESYDRQAMMQSDQTNEVPVVKPPLAQPSTVIAKPVTAENMQSRASSSSSALTTATQATIEGIANELGGTLRYGNADRNNCLIFAISNALGHQIDGAGAQAIRESLVSADITGANRNGDFLAATTRMVDVISQHILSQMPANQRPDGVNVTVHSVEPGIAPVRIGQGTVNAHIVHDGVHFWWLDKTNASA